MIQENHAPQGKVETVLVRECAYTNDPGCLGRAWHDHPDLPCEWVEVEHHFCDCGADDVYGGMDHSNQCPLYVVNPDAFDGIAFLSQAINGELTARGTALEIYKTVTLSHKNDGYEDYWREEFLDKAEPIIEEQLRIAICKTAIDIEVASEPIGNWISQKITADVKGLLDSKDIRLGEKQKRIDELTAVLGDALTELRRIEDFANGSRGLLLTKREADVDSELMDRIEYTLHPEIYDGPRDDADDNDERTTP